MSENSLDWFSNKLIQSNQKTIDANEKIKDLEKKLAEADALNTKRMSRQLDRIGKMYNKIAIAKEHITWMRLQVCDPLKYNTVMTDAIDECLKRISE